MHALSLTTKRPHKSKHLVMRGRSRRAAHFKQMPCLAEDGGVKRYSRRRDASRLSTRGTPPRQAERFSKDGQPIGAGFICNACVKGCNEASSANRRSSNMLQLARIVPVLGRFISGDGCPWHALRNAFPVLAYQLRRTSLPGLPGGESRGKVRLAESWSEGGYRDD
jgi:hypothetical protein